MSNTERRYLNTSIRLLLLVVSLAVLAACSSGPQVRTSFADNEDFSEFRTFSFFNRLSTDRAGYNSMISRQLMDATRREMEARDFVFVESASDADLLINFYVDVASELRVRDTGPMWTGPSYWDHRRGFYDPWRGHRNWPMHSQVSVQQITRGTLSIDLVDASRNSLVWEGVATRRITQSTLNDVGPALSEATQAIFAAFPIVPRL